MKMKKMKFFTQYYSFEILSSDLGDEFFKNEKSKLHIKFFLNSQNRGRATSCIYCFTYSCEGYKKSLAKNLKEVLQFISADLTNNYPRLRYAALFAFGLLLKNKAPYY